jgi:hypothetical protein
MTHCLNFIVPKEQSIQGLHEENRLWGEEIYSYDPPRYQFETTRFIKHMDLTSFRQSSPK